MKVLQLLTYHLAAVHPSIPFLLPWEGGTVGKKEKNSALDTTDLEKSPCGYRVTVPSDYLEWEKPARLRGQRDQSWINKNNKKRTVFIQDNG